MGRDEIAAAVVEVGFHDLTFADVAQRLNIGPATLYRHAENRDELVRLGLERAIQRFDWPETDGTWRELLERWSLASWRAWAAHPGAVLEVTRGVVPPSMVELSDRVGIALVKRGFSPRNAVIAVDLVFDLAADSRRGVEVLAESLETQPASVREVMEREWANQQGISETAAQLRAEMVRAIQEDPVDWFRGKLRIVLSGVEAELAPAFASESTDQEQ